MNQASSWQSMRNSIGLNDNPSPNASTGFKLTTGNAYRKLSESWPIYQPIDGLKDGKGKDSSGWSSTEENEAKNDAPLSTGGGTSDNASKFKSYLNTKQALERIGILFDGDGMRNVVTQLYFQPNKVKSGQYQTTNTYNRLIEPDKWNQSSDLSGMNNLLKLLTTKNIKQKLGKDTQSMGNNGGGVSQTINTITTTGNISGNGTIQTAYPVKKDEASNVAINSLINATPLNSYGDLNNASFSK